MDYTYPKIRLGLCCINMSLKYLEDVFTNRKIILKQIEKRGLEETKNLAKENVIDLLKLIFWNKNHGIDVFRISSVLVPHATNKDLIKLFGKEGEDFLTLNFLSPYLELVGHLAKIENMRLTFHPGQFVQVASPDLDIFSRSVDEIEMHTNFLDQMKLDKNSVAVIHIGGTYCAKEETILRFIERFESLPKKLRDRLVLENDEKCYDASDVISICEKVGAPMVLDIFHYYCYKKYHPDIIQMSLDDLIPRILETWKIRNMRPKFHLSEQQIGSPVGAHSVFVELIPIDLLEIPTKYGVEIDIMIEAKGKEIAIAKLYEKYPDLKPKFRKDLPQTIPKQALKELKYETKIQANENMELANCRCKKS